MKRVLIIPSWYPTAAQLFAGTFFREQAELAMADFDVRVLFVESKAVGRRDVIRWCLLRASGAKLSRLETTLDQGPLKVDRFEAEFAASEGGGAMTREDVAEALVQHYAAQNWRPDVIHAHSAMPAGVLASRLASAWSVPFVVTEHQHLVFDYFSQQDWAAAKHVYEQARRVAAVSEFQRRMMLMQGARPPVMVTGNFVDEERFMPKPERRQPKRILFNGLTLWLKDHETFFKALTLLAKQMSEGFEVTVLSPSLKKAHADNIRSIMAQARIDDRVRLLTSATRDEVVELVQSSAVFVSTSLAETFGVAVVEALMCGCPVVVTDSGGVRDFVIDGQNGFIVPVGDAGLVADRIQDVLQGRLAATPDALRQSVLPKYGRAAFRSLTRSFYSLD